MGREAECNCKWGPDSASVKAILEAGELVIRGAIRHRVAFPQMGEIRVVGDGLVFNYQGQEVSLMLGESIASKWRQIILAPPVSLATKLGITAESFVWNLGQSNDRALESALASAKGLRSDQIDLIVACIHSMEDLAKVLRTTAVQLERGVPLWIVYAKGKGQAVSELMVRSVSREIGLVDTKVASISPVHTALRFVMRK